MVRSPADFIRADLGGAQALATKLGRKPNAIRMWVHRNKIPRTAWPEILDAFRGVKLADLRAVERGSEDAA